ncbi:transthyretin-like family protein [Halalkalicoccus ordinarius]|uniref:hypothetical protein n=1 Tax=Halalkalicoccus ordinarius TaxID=3116651 RepID=UPI00300E8086
MSPAGQRGGVAAVVVLLCLASLAGPGLAAAAGSTADPAFQQSSPSEDNATGDSDGPRHEHPDEAEEEGDLSGVSDHLSAQLSSSLQQSSVEVSQGEYDQAREAVGDDYNEQLSRYVEVAGETDSESDQQAAREFEEAGENQREFIDANEEYQETYEEYQQAKEAGDDERARELARDLERQSEEINETGAELEQNYENLNETTSGDFSEERGAVDETQEDVRSQQAEVETVEFVATELTVTAANEAISFTEPLEAEGRLVTAEGEPIANQEVAFEIGEQTVTTTTDANGEFAFAYRPTALPLNTTSLEIEYRPAPSSAYASASTTVPVSVEQSQPEMTIEPPSQPAAFGDELAVAGTVGVNGIGAPGVPVVITADGERIGQTTTGADGTFEFSGTIPAAVAAGDVTVRASLPLDGQALTAAETTGSVTIEETESQLSLTATGADDGETITASGRLATADDRPVANQPVRILVDGTTVGTVETDETGEYEATVDAPPRADGTAEVTAVYDGAGTNVADAEATDTVSGLSIARTLLDWVWWPGLLVSGLGVLLVLWAYQRRRERPSGPTPAVARETVEDADGADSRSGRVPPGVLLELARERLGEGDPNRAIGLAYVAVRNHFETEDVPGWTHWEFYNETESRLDDAERNTLLSITEQFERAAFAPGAIHQNAATTVISAAEQLIEGSRSRSERTAD